MMDVPHEIAKRIVLDEMHPVAAWRHYYGMSRDMLAKRMQVREEDILKIETTNQHLHPANLSKLSRAFGILPQALEVRYNSFNQVERDYYAKN